MNEHVLMGQIANHIVKGKFETHMPATIASEKVPTGLSDLLQRSMENKVPPPLISTDALDKAMADSIKKYKTGEFLLPDLILRAAYTGKSRELLAEYAGDTESLSKGTAVLATIHGKDYAHWAELAETLLKGLGYKIVGLGDEATAEDVLEAIDDNVPDILWLNTPSTLFPEFKIKPSATIRSQINRITDNIAETGTRKDVSILVGGIHGACGRLPSMNDLDADFCCGNALQTITYLKKLAFSAN